MLRALFRTSCVCGALMLPTVSHAQSADTEACVDGLSANARLIYDAVAPHLPPPDGDGEALMRAHVRPLVQSGELRRRDARAAAEEAEPCLRLAGEDASSMP